MTCDITRLNSPKYGDIWYACHFGTQKGIPYFIEAYSPAAINDHQWKTPPNVASDLIHAIASAAGEQGIELRDYPDLDKKMKAKATSQQIIDRAMKAMGQNPTDQARTDLNRYISGMSKLKNFFPQLPPGTKMAPPNYNPFGSVDPKPDS